MCPVLSQYIYTDISQRIEVHYDTEMSHMEVDLMTQRLAFIYIKSPIVIVVTGMLAELWLVPNVNEN